MKVIIFLFCLISVYSLTAQNVGINQNSPTNSLHISPVNIGDNPLRVDGLQSFSVGDTSLLMINTNTGIVKYINPSDFVSIISGGAGLGTDHQNIDSLILNGYNLTTFITNGNSSSVDLSPLSDSITSLIINNSSLENQIISVLYDNSDTLLYNSSFINNLRDSIDTDIDSLTLNNTTLTIYENGVSASVDLSSLSDNDADPTNELQTISKTGSTVTLSNGGGSFTDDDTQLTETQVDAFVNNNGYLTSFTEVDGSVTNEIQTISKTGSTVTLSNGGGSFTDDDTQLNETQVDAFVNNNGYLTSFTEVDGSVSNELQNLSLSGTTLSISSGNNVNLSSFNDHDWYEVGGTSQPDNITDNIFTQGNVGIGVINPLSRLHIGGNPSGTRRAWMVNGLLIGDDSDGAYFGLKNEGSDRKDAIIAWGDNPDENLRFLFNASGLTTSNEYMRILGTNGNIGINTITPSAKLEIIESTTQNALTVQKDFTGLANTNAAFIGGTDVGFTTTGIYVLQKDNASFVGTNTNTFNVVNNSSSQFVVKGAGNVGIGTLTPSNKLQVNGDVRIGLVNSGAVQPAGYGNSIIFSGAPDVSTSHNGDNSDPISISRYNLASDQSELRVRIGDNTQAQDAFTIGYGNWVERFRFETTGTARKPGGGSWAATSDIRTKKEINPFTDGLTILTQINPVTFKYNGLYNTSDDGQSYVGIIAQEVQEVAPYMIGSYQAPKSPKNTELEEILNYDGGTYMLYVLVNSVKEQQKQIEELKESNKKLLKQVENLNNK